MKVAPPIVIGVLLAGAAVAQFACSDSETSASEVTGAEDASAEAAAAPFTFSPRGCGYVVAPPVSRAFVGLAEHSDTAGAAPLRVRLGSGGRVEKGEPGYTDLTTTAVFTWETAEVSGAAKVIFGTSVDELSQSATGYTWSTPSPESGLGANEPATSMHEVHVCGLTPGTNYFYRVGGGAAGAEVWSEVQSFSTVPNEGTVRVGILGDSRDSVDTWQLAESRMKDAAVHVQLITGDMVLAGNLASLYSQWLDAIWKDPNRPDAFLTLGHQLMIPMAGNHENEATRFYANFSMPGEGEFAETYASFDLASTHFVTFDDQPIALDPTSAQSKAALAWLERDLTKADADRVAHPYILFSSHRGFFSTSKHAEEDDVLNARAAIVPILDKHHVTLVMSGHDHLYERSKALVGGADPRGKPVVTSAPKEGTTYVICAGAGASGYEASSSSEVREKVTTFGTTTPYVGVYCIADLTKDTLTLNAYAMKAAGGGVAGDDLIDTLEWKP